MTRWRSTISVDSPGYIAREGGGGKKKKKDQKERKGEKQANWDSAQSFSKKIQYLYSSLLICFGCRARGGKKEKGGQ